MNRITARAAEAAKAIVAVVTPIVTTAVLDMLTELGNQAQLTIAALATAATVWLTPNRQPPGKEPR